MADEDRELILGLKRRDVVSFEVIFEKYRRPVFSYIRGLVRDRALAEDCVQEVFLELVKNADRIDVARGVRGWLFRVARNKAVDAIRRNGRRALEGDEAVSSESIACSPDAEMIEKEGRVGLMKAISGLQDEEREIIMMRFFGGLTFAEAEQVSGISLNTLIWRCRRALKKLAKDLAADNSGRI